MKPSAALGIFAHINWMRIAHGAPVFGNKKALLSAT
jgi:hypothetical protein